MKKKNARLKQIHENNFKIYCERGGPENETSETECEFQPHQVMQKKKKLVKTRKKVKNSNNYSQSS